MGTALSLGLGQIQDPSSDPDYWYHSSEGRDEDLRGDAQDPAYRWLMTLKTIRLESRFNWLHSYLNLERFHNAGMTVTDTPAVVLKALTRGTMNPALIEIPRMDAVSQKVCTLCFLKVKNFVAVVEFLKLLSCGQLRIQSWIFNEPETLLAKTGIWPCFFLIYVYITFDWISWMFYYFWQDCPIKISVLTHLF